MMQSNGGQSSGLLVGYGIVVSIAIAACSPGAGVQALPPAKVTAGHTGQNAGRQRAGSRVLTAGVPTIAPAVIASGAAFGATLRARWAAAHPADSTPAPTCTQQSDYVYAECFFFASGQVVSMPVTLPTASPVPSPLYDDALEMLTGTRALFTPVIQSATLTSASDWTFTVAPDSAGSNASLPEPPGTPMPLFEFYSATGASTYAGTLTIVADGTPRPNATASASCQVAEPGEIETAAEVSVTEPNGSAAGGDPYYPIVISYMEPAPCPTPVAAVAVAQLAGDFTQDVNGTVAIYEAPPQGDIAFVPPGSGTAGGGAAIGRSIVRSIVGSRRAGTVLASPAPLPSGYRTAPPSLPENNADEVAFVKKLISFTTIGKVVPGCQGFIEEQRADPTALSDPRNPAYYQIQTYCAQGASIASSVVQSTWAGTNYNGTVNEDATISQSCSVQPAKTVLSVTLTPCFTPVTLVPLVLGHAERNEPVALHFDVSSSGTVYPFDTFRFPLLNVTVSDVGTVSSFDLNNRSVPYPVVSAAANWGPPENIVDGNVAPPKSTAGMPWQYTEKGCDPNDGDTGGKLGTALKNAGYPSPTPLIFDAHHLQPSCFGGNNGAANGIWLIARPNSNSLHKIFTTWFLTSAKSANFTP